MSSFSGATVAASPFDGAGTSVLPFGGATMKPLEGVGSEAFLNLTPPGGAGCGVDDTPGKFVFGKFVNITLAVPAGASPMTSAAQLFGKASPFSGTPFGGGFGGPPLGYGLSPFSGTPFGSGGGYIIEQTPVGHNQHR